MLYAEACLGFGLGNIRENFCTQSARVKKSGGKKLTAAVFLVYGIGSDFKTEKESPDKTNRPDAEYVAEEMCHLRNRLL